MAQYFYKSLFSVVKEISNLFRSWTLVWRAPVL